MVPKYHLTTPIAMTLLPAQSRRQKQWLSHSILISALKNLKALGLGVTGGLAMAPQRRKHAPIQSTCHPLSVDILLSYLNKRIPGTYTLNLHFIFIAGNRLTLIPLQRYYDNSRGRVAKCRWTSQYHSVASPAVLETIVHQKLARTATVVLTAKQSSPR